MDLMLYAGKRLHRHHYFILSRNIFRYKCSNFVAKYIIDYEFVNMR